MADHITIGDISPRIQYTADGAQTAFTYPFPIFEDADIEVFEDTTLKTITTHYTVAGAGNSAGGTVTLVTAPASGVVVTLRRAIAIKRTTDFQESGEFRAKVINDELDYQTAALQQVNDDLGRSLRLADTDSANGDMTLPVKASRASMYLGFDANGDPIATDAAGPAGPQGPAGNMDGSNNLSELTDTATARTNLGLGAAAVEAVAAGGSSDLLRADGDGSQLTGLSTGATNAEKANIILNAFRIAVNGGLSVQNMVDGVVDEFEDETGVNTATSTDETYDATNDLYSNPGGYSADLATGGAAISGGSDTAPYLPTSAFDDNTGVDFRTSQSGSGVNGVSYIGYDLGAANDKTIRQFRIWQAGSPNGVSSVKLEYSDNGSTWTTEGTYALSVATGWQTKATSNAGAHRYWRILANAGLGSGQRWWVYEVEFMELNAAPNMMLQSNAQTALAQPDEVLIVVWQENVDAVTPNTDLVAAVSRDGGTTFTNVTLAEEATLSTGRILTGTVDISAQPAGTSMKWKLTVANNKEMKIHGVGLEWS